MGLTEHVAEFVATIRFDEVPAEVRRLARRSLLDGLGLAIAGSRSPASLIARGEVARYGHLQEEASVLGTPQKAPARFAAFLNGISIHSDDFDDTQLAVHLDRVYGLLTHPTAPVLPASLALGEREQATGEELLLTYLIGVEVATKVAEAIDPRHYADGFHSTGTAGTLGAAAAAARALGLDERATAVTLGLGASQAAGLRENFGTMTKPFHAGRAAESGVLAASLAAAGFTAATNILEAPRGYFNAAGGGFDAAAIEGRLGSPWTFADPGISIKPHPSGSLTHPAMGAFLELVEYADLRPADVKSIRVGTNRHMPNALIHHRPTDGLQAKFSMEFCIAILLVKRRAGLQEFTDGVVVDPRVREVMDRVVFEVDPRADRDGFREMTSLIDVELFDGRTYSARADFAKGSPANPMSDEEVTDKFVASLAWAGVGEGIARHAALRILAIDAEPSVAAILQPFQRDSSERAR